MIWIYCPRKSDGARALAKALGAKRWTTAADDNDLVVNWGSRALNEACRGRWLNGAVANFANKYEEMRALAEAGIRVPDHQRKHPGKAGFHARLFRHHEANDLLANLDAGDYYVAHVDTVREFRIHVFNGVSIRAGLKAPRIAEPHPVFRSWNAGWGLYYGAECQKYLDPTIREVAKKAVAALGYSFGAVDVAVQNSGKPIVWEVNSAPGLEGKTVDAYANAFRRYDANR